ncbi:MAG: hypothetical protein ACRDRI_20325 [Pseudonocardiaceae bacterium]
MPGPSPHRRRVLAAAAALFLAGPAVSAGCTLPARTPQGPDPLESPARRAEADAALATGVAQLVAHADPAMATTARALAADRMAHAATLRAELRRARPGSAPRDASPPAAPPPAAPPPAEPDLAGTRSTLTQAARAAQDEATKLVVTLPGYRAALLASVAACCATHAALLS